MFEDKIDALNQARELGTAKKKKKTTTAAKEPDSPTTIDGYYKAEVNHDMPQFAG